jgi:hypothetical protein
VSAAQKSSRAMTVSFFASINIGQSAAAPGITPWPLIIVIGAVAVLSLLIIWAQNTTPDAAMDDDPDLADTATDDGKASAEPDTSGDAPDTDAPEVSTEPEPEPTEPTDAPGVPAAHDIPAGDPSGPAENAP